LVLEEVGLGQFWRGLRKAGLKVSDELASPEEIWREMGKVLEEEPRFSFTHGLTDALGEVGLGGRWGRGKGHREVRGDGRADEVS
jgi:hypothetical protein